MLRTLFVLAGLGLTTVLTAQHPLRSYAQDQDAAPRAHGLDFLELKLDLNFVPDSGLVKGTVTHTFKAKRLGVESFFLDAPGIQILSLQLDNKSADFESVDGGIRIPFAQSPDTSTVHSLRISYRVKPKKGLYFIGWDDPTGRCRKQIWTQGQGIDNRHWIPMYDSQNDKVISEITLNFDSDFEVVSNGKLIEKKKQGNGTTRWHYRMPYPHATYLMMLGIGKYDVLEKQSASGVPMRLLYYPEFPEQAEPTYRYSVEMFDFFEKEIGYPYPWGSYAQVPVQDFMYGAMENTTATIFGDFFLVDNHGYHDRNYVAVNAHELAHQWFGDLVTARSLQHHWLQESFATFYNMMYEQEVFGKDHYDWKRYQAAQSALKASEADLLPIAHTQAGTVRYYPKGAVVLHMLRHLVGRENYNKAIRLYLHRHAFANVDSDDLLNAFQDGLGLSLDYFWDQWVYKGGEPHYEVSADLLGGSSTNRVLVFTVKQTQAISPLNSVFDMPMRFEAHFEDGSKVQTEARIHKTEQSVRLELPDKKNLSYWLADPNRHILGSMKQMQPQAHFKAMVEKAEGVLDRFYALQQLRSMEFAQRLPLLSQVIQRKGEFHALKAEALQQLTDHSNDPAVQELFAKALNDTDQEVRKAAVDLLQQVPDALVEPLVAQFALDHASYQLQESTLRLLCRHRPKEAARWIAASGKGLGNRGQNLGVARLEMQVQHAVKAEEALAALEDLCSPAHEFITRTQAWQALYRLNVLTEAMLETAPQALSHANRRLAGPIAATLKDFYGTHRHRITIDRWLAQNPQHQALFASIRG